MAAGSGKSKVLKQVLQGNYNPDLYPSQIIKPKGELHWFIDITAAADL
jgi:6-phosphogluconolactonase